MKKKANIIIIIIIVVGLKVQINVSFFTRE